MKKNCPTQENFQRFLSAHSTENERDSIELHLAECAECRSNLALMFAEKTETENFAAPASLKEKAKNLPEKPKANSTAFFSFTWLKANRWQVGFASILLICFGLLGIFVWQNQAPPNSDDVLRNGSTKSVFKLLAPEDNSVIEGSFVDFEWEKMSDTSSYTLIISDEKGDIIFQEQTKQNKFRFGRAYPSQKANEQDYCFWFVQAKSVDGRIWETAPRKIIFKR